MTLEELKNLREQIQNDASGVTDEQLSAGRDAIQAIRAEHATTAATPEIVETLRELVEVRNAVVGEQDTRATAAAEVNAEAARLLAEFDEPEQPADTTEQNETPVDENETDAPAETVVEAREPELVAASGAIADAVAKGIAQAFANQTPAVEAAPVAPQGRTGRPTSTSVVATSGDVATGKVYLGSHSEQGRPITSELDVARAIHEKFRGAYQASGSQGRMPVLTVDTEFPESRVLGSDVESNFEKIRAATSTNALVAAGGLCAPLEVLYDIEVLGSTARPIRDALARFAVERGGIQFRPNSSAAAAVNGAGVWTMANDDTADDPETATVKACYVVDCPDLEEASIQAIYSCLEFSNITSRFDPESTASNVREGLIAHARLAERELFKAMAAEAKLVDSNPQEVGATRHILVEMDKLSAYYRDRHRLESNQTMTWLAPHWVRDLMRSDIAYQMAAGDWQDALGVAEAMVDGWFSRRSISPVWFLDGAPAQATVNATVIPPQVYANLAAGDLIPAYPAKIDSLLYPTGSYLFIDGGSLDLGLVRDSVLNTRNRYRQFSETFEGVAFRGVEALRPVFEVIPTGTTGATTLVGDGS